MDRGSLATDDTGFTVLIVVIRQHGGAKSFIMEHLTNNLIVK